jgi:hypothetical protein
MRYLRTAVGSRRSWWWVVVGLWTVVLLVSVVGVRVDAQLQNTAFTRVVLRPSLPEAPSVFASSAAR